VGNESEEILVIELKDGKVQRFREFFDTFAASEAFRATKAA
jgi:ketosteroid isomerase-like protein